MQKRYEALVMMTLILFGGQARAIGNCPDCILNIYDDVQLGSNTGTIGLGLPPKSIYLAMKYSSGFDRCGGIEFTGVYQFELSGSIGTMRVYTARTDFALDDIPALRGLLEAGYGYFWRVFKLSAASSTDDLVTLENRAANAWSVGTPRRFLFQPL